MRHVRWERSIAAVIAMVSVAACGSTTNLASGHPSPGLAASATAGSASASPSAGPSPSPAPADLRLVIQDYATTEVRVARMDAVDLGHSPGFVDGVVGGQVIVLNRNQLVAITRAGAVRTLATLAGSPDWSGFGSVAVKPDLSQWIYALRDDNANTYVHLGSAGADKLIATIPSPDGNAAYRAFAWNSSGIYFELEPIGLGGAGPFLEYHFPLARFDLSSNKLAVVSPECYVEQVLDNGTMICRRKQDFGIEIRPPSGSSHVIQLATPAGSSYDNTSAYKGLLVSPDSARLIAARNGAPDPTKALSYQMAVASLNATTAQAFGPLDFVPDTFLPDGRVVGHHECALPDWGGAPCSASLDGTYIFSADGSSKTLFYKLKQGSEVVAWV